MTDNDSKNAANLSKVEGMAETDPSTIENSSNQTASNSAPNFADERELCKRFYNATVACRRLPHDELLLLRVCVDGARWEFTPGQYTLLGLGPWEPRIDGVSSAWPDGIQSKQPLIRRAYSISCAVLDGAGKLQTCSQSDELEFYITLVARPIDQPPMLTPRLFALREGDRLFVGRKAHGRYTLDPVRADDDVIFVATGTGEAPHNAMIAELLHRGHQGLIISVVCVRHERDLGYVETHRTLEQRYGNFRYFTLTTREGRNLDPSHSDFVGKQYVQEFVESGELERRLGRALDPTHTQFFLCGSPAMIGLPADTHDGHLVYPEPPGMVETLLRRGFRLDKPRQTGNVHYEKYW